MPVTMVRLNLVEGLGRCSSSPRGYTVTLPDEVHKTLDMRTDPTWPTTWFAPKPHRQGPLHRAFTPSWPTGAPNHGAFVYGHIGKDLITLPPC